MWCVGRGTADGEAEASTCGLSSWDCCVRLLHKLLRKWAQQAVLPMLLACLGNARDVTTDVKVKIKHAAACRGPLPGAKGQKPRCFPDPAVSISVLFGVAPFILTNATTRPKHEPPARVALDTRLSVLGSGRCVADVPVSLKFPWVRCSVLSRVSSVVYGGWANDRE